MACPTCGKVEFIISCLELIIAGQDEEGLLLGGAQMQEIAKRAIAAFEIDDKPLDRSV